MAKQDYFPKSFPQKDNKMWIKDDQECIPVG